jgi:hypothetical protein
VNGVAQRSRPILKPLQPSTAAMGDDMTAHEGTCRRYNRKGRESRIAGAGRSGLDEGARGFLSCGRRAR